MVYVIETWWVSLHIITAHLKHTNSTINQCPSWSLCSICRITIRICRDTRHTLWSMRLKLGEFHYTLIITAHLKHTNSTINQCPSWSLCSICRTTNKEPQGYEAYSVVYVIETWWVSLYIITAHLKHTNSTINQCPSWSLCSICRITIRNRRETRHTLWSMRLKLGEFHYTLSLHTWSTLILPLINVRADHCVLYAGQQIRNRRDTRHTLWCMWLKLGEFHYTLSLHI